MIHDSPSRWWVQDVWRSAIASIMARATKIFSMDRRIDHTIEARTIRFGLRSAILVQPGLLFRPARLFGGGLRPRLGLRFALRGGCPLVG